MQDEDKITGLDQEVRTDWRAEFVEHRDRSSARIQEIRKQNEAEFANSKQSNEAEFEEWNVQQGEMVGAAFNAMASVSSGDEALVKRSLAEFNRLLNWHVQSRQIWKAGSSTDQIQLSISNQFLPDVLDTWVVDQTFEDCTEEELERLEELKRAVSQDAEFLVMHIEKKLGLDQGMDNPVPQPQL